MSKIFSFIREIAANIFSSKKNIAIAVAVSSVVFGTSIGLAITQPHNCEKNYELVSTTDATCVLEGAEIYQCKKCGEQKEIAISKIDHSYRSVSVASATCTEQGKEVFACSGCNDTYTDIIENALGHDYGAEEVVIPASCDAEGKTVQKCKRCDHTKENTVQKTEHTYQKIGELPVTCTSDGTIYYQCSNCRIVESVVIPTNGHYMTVSVHTDPTCTEGGYTKSVCTVYGCAYSEEKTVDALGHSHTLSSSNEADCTVDGVDEFICSRCSDTYTVVTQEKYGHNYVVTDEINVSCTVDGKKTYMCTRCYDTYTEKTEGALGHAYDLTSSTEANCTVDGVDEFTCSRCFDAYTVVTQEKYGHNYVVTDEINVSCTVDGEKTYTCTRCDDAYTEKTEDALGHAYSLISSTEADCTVDGVDEFICSRCSDTYTVVTQEKYGHDYTITNEINVSCTVDGEETYTCTRCSDTYTVVTQEKYGHNYVVTNEIKVSCTVDGKKTYTCTRCDDAYTESTGNATGHDYREAKNLPATCTREGLITYSCVNTDCEESYEEVLKQLEHPYELVFSSVATCADDGIDVFKCSVCSDTYEVMTEKAKGHNYIVLTVIDVSCTEDGQITYFCTNCQDRYSEVTDRAYGHNYIDVLVTPATCISNGIIYSQCSKCNALKTEFNDPLGHLISESSRLEATCTTDGYIRYSCTRDNCTAGYVETISKLNHAPANYATIHTDAVCVRCNIILQHKLDNELGINYYLGYADTYYSTPVYTQDRTGHDLGNHNYYSTPNPVPGSEIVFNDSISLEDFYSHVLLTSKPVTTNDGKHYYVDGGFSVSFDFRTLINESFDNGEMNIQQYSDFLLQFESDSMLKLVKEDKSSDKYYTIYEVIDFAYSTIEVAKLVDGKYVTVAIIDNPQSWDAVWSLDEIVLSDSNGRMFFDSGTYRVMFKFDVAWFIESPNGVIYDGTGNVCYPYGILNDIYDYFYVTVTDDTYNVLVPDDVDESRDLFYQIGLDDIKGGAPFLKSGDSVDVEDNIDILFDSKIGTWNSQVHYNGNVLTEWTMSYYLYDLESDSYVVQSSYNLFETLDANGVGKIKISKSNQTGDCKITVSYTLTDETTGVSTTYVDVYYLNIS